MLNRRSNPNSLAGKAWAKSKGNKKPKRLGKSKSETTQLKDEIQALLRQIVIERDGGCIFRNYPDAGRCGGYRKDGELILQADHISSRANSQTYGLSQNVVCICRNHHTFWKRQYPSEWTDLTRNYVGVAVFDRMIALGREKARQSFTAWDWAKVAYGLKDELTKLKKRAENSTGVGRSRVSI
jgi:hypothetical protein